MVHHLTGLEFAHHIPQEQRDEIVHETLEELETDEAFQEVDPGEWKRRLAPRIS
jgi:hypothetical protein